MSARAGDRVQAMTADTFTTVALDPPVVLVAVARAGRTHEVIRAAGGYAVSVLASSQEPLARSFADPGRSRDAAQLDAVGWWAAPQTGAPLLHGALGWLECRLRDLVPVGDHVLVLGDVGYADVGARAPALLRFESAYRRVTPR